jgi:hypothetical protein
MLVIGSVEVEGRTTGFLGADLPDFTCRGAGRTRCGRGSSSGTASRLGQCSGPAEWRRKLRSRPRRSGADRVAVDGTQGGSCRPASSCLLPVAPPPPRLILQAVAMSGCAPKVMKGRRWGSPFLTAGAGDRLWSLRISSLRRTFESVLTALPIRGNPTHRMTFGPGTAGSTASGSRRTDLHCLRDRQIPPTPAARPGCSPHPAYCLSRKTGPFTRGGPGRGSSRIERDRRFLSDLQAA